MRLVFMVTGEISEPTFADSLSGSHEVIGLVTQPDRPVGRKQLVAARIGDRQHHPRPRGHAQRRPRRRWPHR